MDPKIDTLHSIYFQKNSELDPKSLKQSIEALQSIPFFARYEFQQAVTQIQHFSQIANILSFQQIPKGQILYSQGELQENIFIILQGEIYEWISKTEQDINEELYLNSNLAELYQQMLPNEDGEQLSNSQYSILEIQEKIKEVQVKLKQLKNVKEDKLLQQLGQSQFFLRGNLCKLRCAKKIQRGEVLPTTPLISQSESKATAIAMQDSQVLILKISDFLSIISVKDEDNKINAVCTQQQQHQTQFNSLLKSPKCTFLDQESTKKLLYSMKKSSKKRGLTSEELKQLEEQRKSSKQSKQPISPEAFLLNKDYEELFSSINKIQGTQVNGQSTKSILKMYQSFDNKFEKRFQKLLQEKTLSNQKNRRFCSRCSLKTITIRTNSNAKKKKQKKTRKKEEGVISKAKISDKVVALQSFKILQNLKKNQYNFNNSPVFLIQSPAMQNLLQKTNQKSESVVQKLQRWRSLNVSQTGTPPRKQSAANMVGSPDILQQNQHLQQKQSALSFSALLNSSSESKNQNKLYNKILPKLQKASGEVQLMKNGSQNQIEQAMSLRNSPVQTMSKVKEQIQSTTAFKIPNNNINKQNNYCNYKQLQILQNLATISSLNNDTKQHLKLQMQNPFQNHLKNSQDQKSQQSFSVKKKFSFINNNRKHFLDEQHQGVLNLNPSTLHNQNIKTQQMQYVVSPQNSFQQSNLQSNKRKGIMKITGYNFEAKNTKY